MAATVERRVVFPGSAKPVGPYSPGIFAGEYLYVSGQGARDAQNQLPPDVEGQTRQCMENVKTIVEAAGLTMDNVVYTHAYLADMNNYAAMNKMYATYFPKVLPARSTIGVARMPTGTPVEISAVAVRDSSKRSDRVFLSGILGRDAEKNVTPADSSEQIRICLDQMHRVLTAAHLRGDNLVYLSVYRTVAVSEDALLGPLRKSYPQTAMSSIEVSSLPFGASVAVTGLAVHDLKQKQVFRRDGSVTCASAAETVYCAAEKAGPGAEAIDAAGAQIEAGLKSMGTDLTRAVANNVYLANIDDFAKMNAVYAKVFPSPPPSRTTVQPSSSGAPAVQLAVVAVR